MSITAISRDWGVKPSLVRITTTDTLTVLTAPGYLDAQKAFILDLNKGAFQWEDGDGVYVYYSGGEGIFNRDTTTGTLSPMLPASVLQYAAVPVLATEFKTMYTTPKLIVPAAGAGLLIVVDHAITAMTYGSAQYTGGGASLFQYDATANGAGVAATATVAAASFTGAAASQSNMFNGALSVAPFTTTVNKGIYLSNQTAVFAAGDSNFVAHIWYHVVSTV